jgi:hypothetical protein
MRRTRDSSPVVIHELSRYVSGELVTLVGFMAPYKLGVLICGPVADSTLHMTGLQAAYCPQRLLERIPELQRLSQSLLLLQRLASPPQPSPIELCLSVWKLPGQCRISY